MDTQTKFSEAAPPTPLPPQRARAVTPRAVLLALLLMPINAYWGIMMENIRYSAHPTTISLFFNCIFILVVLTGLNGLVTRVRPRWAFAQGELLLVYSMLCIGACVNDLLSQAYQWSPRSIKGADVVRFQRLPRRSGGRSGRNLVTHAPR